ncbi:MAG: hypothetical protein JSV96_17835 [Candidatus Aminicenantes bacterium]|nr:MAG: hypothetical protein JSV96_17835 [Candidatus Aminicenantes bacterium]
MSQENANATATSRVLMPRAGSVYGFGWEKMKKFFLDLFLISIIVGVVLIPVGMTQSLDGQETAGGVLLRIFAFAYWLLLYAPIDYGSAFIFLRAVRNEQFEVKDMFLTFQNYLNVVLAHLLVGAIIAIGVTLLLVPGIIFACKLAFVKYLVTDKNMDPVEAVKESWRMTTGYATEIFLMGLLAIPIGLAGILCFGVGLIPAIMWIRCAFASMYYAVSEIEKEKT